MPPPSSLILVSGEVDPLFINIRRALAASTSAINFHEVVSTAARVPPGELFQLDLVGHGSAGCLAIGPRGQPDTILENCHSTFSRFKHLRRRFHPAGKGLRLLGCGVGMVQELEPWMDGVALAFSLSRLLSTKVSVSITAISDSDFDSRGLTEDAERSKLITIDADLHRAAFPQ